MDTEVVTAFVTFPSPDSAASTARTLVTEQLAACANLLPSVRSIYVWEGAVMDEPETLAVFKTTSSALERFTRRLVALHPYDCPEVIAVPVVGGHADYLAWVQGQTVC